MKTIVERIADAVKELEIRNLKPKFLFLSDKDATELRHWVNDNTIYLEKGGTDRMLQNKELITGHIMGLYIGNVQAGFSYVKSDTGEIGPLPARDNDEVDQAIFAAHKHAYLCYVLPKHREAIAKCALDWGDHLVITSVPKLDIDISNPEKIAVICFFDGNYIGGFHYNAVTKEVTEERMEVLHDG